MEKVHEFLSLKKYNRENIDNVIEKKEEIIKSHLDLIFIDVLSAQLVGYDLIELARMKDARLLMATEAYKAYETSGKLIPYGEFLTMYNSDR